MDTPKFRIVLVSHGEQSKGMLNTVQMLLGEQQNIIAHSLYPEQSVADLTEALKKEIEIYGVDNIIFMTELMYGSPFNAVVSLTRDYDVYHVTGINLAMLMGALLERDEEETTIQAICDAAIEAAQDSYADVRKILAASEDEEDDDE